MISRACGRAASFDSCANITPDESQMRSELRSQRPGDSSSAAMIGLANASPTTVSDLTAWRSTVSSSSTTSSRRDVRRRHRRSSPRRR